MKKYFMKIKTNIRQTWNVINKVIGKAGNRSRLEIKSIIKDGFEICEFLNDFFHFSK